MTEKFQLRTFVKVFPVAGSKIMLGYHEEEREFTGWGDELREGESIFGAAVRVMQACGIGGCSRDNITPLAQMMILPPAGCVFRIGAVALRCRESFSIADQGEIKRGRWYDSEALTKVGIPSFKATWLQKALETGEGWLGVSAAFSVDESTKELCVRSDAFFRPALHPWDFYGEEQSVQSEGLLSTA